MRGEETSDAPRHSHGFMSHQAELGDRLAVLIKVHVPMCGKWCHFTEVQRVDGAVRRANDHQAATADVPSPRRHHGQGPVNGHGSVDRITTPL